MRRNAHTDRFAARVQQATRHDPRRVQDEGIGAARSAFDQPKLPVVDACIHGCLGKVAAQQPEMVACIDLANCADAFHRRLVADPASECVAGVGREHDHPAAANDLDRLADQPRLRVVGMNGEELCHG